MERSMFRFVDGSITKKLGIISCRSLALSAEGEDWEQPKKRGKTWVIYLIHFPSGSMASPFLQHLLDTTCISIG